MGALGINNIMTYDILVQQLLTEAKKGMSRRQFLKVGAGGALGTTINPMDAFLKAWPGIINQVATKAISAGPLLNILKAYKHLSQWWEGDYAENRNRVYSPEETSQGIKYWDNVNDWSKNLISRIENNDLNFTANDEKMFQGMTNDSNFINGSMQDFIELTRGVEGVKQADEIMKELPGYDDGLKIKSKDYKDGENREGQTKDKAEVQTKNKAGAQTKNNTTKKDNFRRVLKGKDEKDKESIKYSRMDRAGGSEDVGYAQTYESFNQLINMLLEKNGPSLSIKRGEKLPVSKGAGLTAKGRAKYNRATGSHLKAPVTGKTKKGSKASKRRKSFCSRSKAWIPSGGCGGKDTRGCAARRRWKC